MSLETQTVNNLLFKVSTDQYEDIAENARKAAARKVGARETSVEAKTVLHKETVLTSLFDTGPKVIEVDNFDELDAKDWQGATAVTTLTDKKGRNLGEVVSSADEGRSARVSVGEATVPPVMEAFEETSLSKMITALQQPEVSSSLKSTTAMDRAVPAVFTSEEPASVFSTPATETPSFARFVEAVVSSLDKADSGATFTESSDFLPEIKEAMPGFFAMIASNDDAAPSFAGRGMGGYAQEAVTFAHEGLGVRRDVIDTRHSELQDRFMKVMKAISAHETTTTKTVDFGLDLAA